MILKKSNQISDHSRRYLLDQFKLLQHCSASLHWSHKKKDTFIRIIFLYIIPSKQKRRWIPSKTNNNSVANQLLPLKKIIKVGFTKLQLLSQDFFFVANYKKV